MPNSSSNSRARACSGLSPASILPPGNSHSSAIGWSGAALTDQDFAAAHDQRRCHKAQRGASRPRIGFWLYFFHTIQCKRIKRVAELSGIFPAIIGAKNGAYVAPKAISFQKDGHFASHSRIGLLSSLRQKVAPAVFGRRFEQSPETD